MSTLPKKISVKLCSTDSQQARKFKKSPSKKLVKSNKTFSWNCLWPNSIFCSFLTQELSKTYPQNFCMSPNLFKLAWMKDPYGYMNLPEYGFPQGPYSPARAISKIGVYFGSKFSNCHIGLGFNLRSISFNV